MSVDDYTVRKDDEDIGVGVKIVAFLLMIPIIWGCFAYDKYVCTQSFIGRQTRYDYFTAGHCFVETGRGIWTPAKQVRAVP